MRPHVFHSSGMKDAYGRSICARCDNVRGHRIHEVPETSEEARELDERKLGESEVESTGTQAK